MDYSEDFKEKVRKIFGNQYDYLLSNGREILGRYLDDGSSNYLSLDTIINARSLEELKEKAFAMKEKRDLYAEWFNLYRPKY